MGCPFSLMTEPVREPGDGFKDNVVVLVIFDLKIIPLESAPKPTALAVRTTDPGGRF